MPLILPTCLYLTNFQHHNANTVENTINYKYQRKKFCLKLLCRHVIYSNGIIKLLFFKDWLENLTLFVRRWVFLLDSFIIFPYHREVYNILYIHIFYLKYSDSFLWRRWGIFFSFRKWASHLRRVDLLVLENYVSCYSYNPSQHQ